MAKQVNIEISTKTILHIIVVGAAVYLGVLIVDIILLLFIAILLTAALSPLVKVFEKAGLSRGIAIAIIYASLVIIIGAVLVLVLPAVYNQAASLLKSFSIPQETIKTYVYRHLDSSSLSSLISQAQNVPQLLGPLNSVFSVLVYITTLAVMVFYLLIQRHQLHKHIHSLLNDSKSEKQLEQFIDQLELKIGSWVRGELALMFIVGILTYIGLLLLQIPYALPLAVIAGMLEVLPNLGPTLSAVPAFVVALTTGSPAIAIGVLALYILIQQLENNLIVPIVMQQSVGINPIVTIIILLVGLRLGGIMGAVLAIPIFIVCKASFFEYKALKHG